MGGEDIFSFEILSITKGPLQVLRTVGAKDLLSQHPVQVGFMSGCSCELVKNGKRWEKGMT